MNDNRLLGIIFICVGALLVFGTAAILDAIKGEIHYEDLCVDGDGDVNLEGIMCDKVRGTYIGMDPEKLSVADNFLIQGLFLIILFVGIVGGMILAITGVLVLTRGEAD